MTIDEAKAFLTCARNWTVFEQQAKRESITLAFSYFWQSNPTMREFAAYTTGLVISPEILWLMVREGAH